MQRKKKEAGKADGGEKSPDAHQKAGC
jgi:hypothetical protein